MQQLAIGPAICYDEGMIRRLLSGWTGTIAAARRGGVSRNTAALLLCGAALAAPVYAAASGGIGVLDTLERGRWAVRDLDSGQARAPVCLGSGVQFVQPEHEGPACPQEIVEDGKTTATVQYSCSGRGFGHTHLRVETPRLVRIDTQGLKNGRPFSYRLEAKRVGIC